MPRPTKLSFFDAHGWTETPQVPHREWQVAVANGDTQAGYMEFVVAQMQSAGRLFQFEDPNLELEVMEADPLVSPEVANRFSQGWWQEEVASLDTRRGYAKWATAQQASLEDEENETLERQADAGLGLSDRGSRLRTP